MFKRCCVAASFSVVTTLVALCFQPVFADMHEQILSKNNKDNGGASAVFMDASNAGGVNRVVNISDVVLSEEKTTTTTDDIFIEKMTSSDASIDPRCAPDLKTGIDACLARPSVVLQPKCRLVCDAPVPAPVPPKKKVQVVKRQVFMEMPRTSVHGELTFSGMYGTEADGFSVKDLQVLQVESPVDPFKFGTKLGTDAAQLYGDYPKNQFFFKHSAKVVARVRSPASAPIEYGVEAEFQRQAPDYRGIVRRPGYLYATQSPVNISRLFVYAQHGFGRAQFGVAPNVADSLSVEPLRASAVPVSLFIGSFNIEGQSIPAFSQLNVISLDINGQPVPPESGAAQKRENTGKWEVPARHPFFLSPVLYTQYVSSGVAPWSGDTNGGNTGQHPLTATVVSPKYSGLYVAGSYVPDIGGTLRRYSGDHVATYQNIFSGVVSFADNYDDMFISVSAAGEMGTHVGGTPMSAENIGTELYPLQAWKVGAGVNVSGVDLLFGYGNNGKSGINKAYYKVNLEPDYKDASSKRTAVKSNPADTYYWSAAASYKWSALDVSLVYYKTYSAFFDMAKQDISSVQNWVLAASYEVTSEEQPVKFIPYAAVDFFDTIEGASLKGVRPAPATAPVLKNNSGYMMAVGARFAF